MHFTRRTRRAYGLALVFSVWTAVVVVSGQHQDHAPPAAFAGRIGLYDVGSVLGPFTRRISSSNQEAQAFFNQGFQLTYAFAKPEAVRSFREAETRDPTCAICYWGEAWAWGSDLNWAMGPDEAPHAYAAIQKAVALAGAHATPIEQALIQAMSVRYVEHFDPAKRVEQDRAFAEAMKTVADSYPDDPDVATIYAEALLLLEPRAGRHDIHAPNVQRILGVLERVLKTDLRHPGACHLYIHATEATAEPERAAACAAFLGSAIPGASHINHMPSHTWTQIGRWGDAVRANLNAWHSDLKSQVGEGIAIYPWHDLEMLVFAASMDGQGAIAMQAGRDYARLTKNPIYLFLTLVRFGRFEDILDVTTRPSGLLSGPVWDFAQGYAHLRAGNADAARADLARLQEAADSSTAPFGANPARKPFGILAGILAGEIRASWQQSAGRRGGLREGRLHRRLADLGGTGVAALQRASLARRHAAPGRPRSGRRAGLSRRPRETPAQRLVPSRPRPGARRPEETDERHRDGIRPQLGAIGYLDSRLGVLSSGLLLKGCPAADSDRRDPRESETAPKEARIAHAAVRTPADRRGARQFAIRADGGGGFERRVRGGRRTPLRRQTGIRRTGLFAEVVRTRYAVSSPPAQSPMEQGRRAAVPGSADS